jgi:YegS/Rv2252/BmrU family lipid kinase
MEDSCVILNPAARSTRARQSRDRITRLARRSGAIIKLTNGPGDAEAQAERAVSQGYTTIVAAGGDGTINEVVNGIDGASVSLGILPIGTMNVFALELGIPWDLDQAWGVITRGRIRHTDLASANDHRFVQLAGVGLDAQIVERTDSESKNALGPLSYLLTATQIVGERPPRLRIHADGEMHEGSFVLIGNGRFYGGPIMLFTEAQPDDGLLDVCLFKYMNYLHLMRYLRGILFGAHTKFSDVRYFKSRSIRVEADEPVPVEVDGELYGHLPCEFTVARRRLHVIVP